MAKTTNNNLVGPTGRTSIDPLAVQKPQQPTIYTFYIALNVGHTVSK